MALRSWCRERRKTTRTTQAGLRRQDWQQATGTHADAENAGEDGTADASFGTADAHTTTSPGTQAGTDVRVSDVLVHRKSLSSWMLLLVKCFSMCNGMSTKESTFQDLALSLSKAWTYVLVLVHSKGKSLILTKKTRLKRVTDVKMYKSDCQETNGNRVYTSRERLDSSASVPPQSAAQERVPQALIPWITLSAMNT